jgi:hypothetical protein
MLVQVRYGRIEGEALERALACGRCITGGVDISTGRPCPRCKGTGRDDHGYAYGAGGLSVRVGSVVVVPPTKLTSHPQEATVVSLGSDYEFRADVLVEVVDY